jgi:hypothetical protein
LVVQLVNACDPRTERARQISKRASRSSPSLAAVKDCRKSTCNSDPLCATHATPVDFNPTSPLASQTAVSSHGLPTLPNCRFSRHTQNLIPHLWKTPRACGAHRASHHDGSRLNGARRAKSVAAIVCAENETTMRKPVNSAESENLTRSASAAIAWVPAATGGSFTTIRF